MIRVATGLTLLAASLAWGLGVSPRGFQGATAGAELYESFMKLSTDQRRAHFDTLGPDAKARLKRTHAERWLAENRRHLTPAQAALVEEAIAFFTPALYQHPADGAKRRQEDDLRSRLVCSLSSHQVGAAFTFLPQPEKLTWRGAVDEWLAWFSECVVK